MNIQFLILFAIICIIFVLILRLNRTFKFQNKISKYTIYSKKLKKFSVFDLIEYEIKEEVIKCANFFKGLNIKVDRFKKYDLVIEDRYYFLASKTLLFLISFVGISIYNIIVFEKLVSIFSIIPIFCYLLLNIVYKIKLYQINLKIRKDLLNVIIIMNNQFKSNKNLIQSIEKVIKETDGILKTEFEKIHKDISYGLGIDIAFNRFANRINIDEAKYISSSLAIYSNSGGNIIKVFKNIEKTLQNKNKIYMELNSVISNTKAMAKVLMIIPVVFFLVMYFFNPKYFDVFFNNVIGNIVLMLIVLLYGLYIYIINKITKVQI